MGVPVRVPPEPAADLASASSTTLVLTEDGDFWHATVADLVALEHGALGLSSGLAYVSARSAPPEEILSLAQPLAAAGARHYLTSV